MISSRLFHHILGFVWRHIGWISLESTVGLVIGLQVSSHFWQIWRAEFASTVQILEKDLSDLRCFMKNGINRYGKWLLVPVPINQCNTMIYNDNPSGFNPWHWHFIQPVIGICCNPPPHCGLHDQLHATILYPRLPDSFWKKLPNFESLGGFLSGMGTQVGQDLDIGFATLR